MKESATQVIEGDAAATAAPAVQWKKRDYDKELTRLRRIRFVIVSFPKSGRTWHRVMLGRYLAAMCGLPERDAFDLPQLCDAAAINRIAYSHNGANFDDGHQITHPLFASPALWQDRRVMLIVRNPKDILVSAYHHARFRNFTFAGTLSEFVRDPRTGIIKIMAAMNRWHDNSRLAAQFDVVSYEGMHRSPEQVLRTTLRRAGVVEIDEALIRETVEFCRFEKMQEYEQTNFFQSVRLSNPSHDPRANKVRAGRVEGYRDYLSAEDDAFIDAHVRSVGDPFASLAGGPANAS